MLQIIMALRSSAVVQQKLIVLPYYCNMPVQWGQPAAAAQGPGEVKTEKQEICE